MPITITMPALSPTMTEGNLANWTVSEGDTIESGDVIAEIETDKATMEVEAVDEGKIAKILVPGGTANVAVNTPIAILLEEGEDESALDGYSVEGGAAPAADAAPANDAAPAAEAAPAPAAAAPAAAAEAPKKEGRVFASPLAKRLAKDAGIDVGAIAGSGPYGRVVKRDVEKAKAEGVAAPKAAAAPAAAPAAAAPAPTSAAYPPLSEEFDAVANTNMRKTIARRLTESKQTIPHFYLNKEVELDALLALRKQLNSASDAYKLSVNDFVVKASALALIKVPEANASWTDDAIWMYKHADISVAVAIDGGLITPVVKNAEQKTLSTISAEVKDLAGRAREGKLKPEEYAGGTFSISNLGMFGIDNFNAIVNPPQGAILAVGAGVQKPVVKGGEIVPATVMTVTLSCDHRVIDGAVGAQLLQAFADYIENPMSMLV